MKIKIDFYTKNSKKFLYYNEELVTNSNFQTQLSRKLQRFRTCRKNKKCSIFHDLSEYIIFSYGCNLMNWSFKPKPRLRLSETFKEIILNDYCFRFLLNKLYLKFF